MTLQDITGHDEIKARLKAAAQEGRVSHAYLFWGTEGVGKTAAAQAFAALLTEDSPADIIRVTNEHYGIKDKLSLAVETVRLARADMFTKPYRADKKVFLFPAADRMTPGAQNALLKVLEEPPPYCVIILIAKSAAMLLPTIRSRVAAFRFLPLSAEEVSAYLSKKLTSFDSLAVRLCGGSIKKAEAMASDADSLEAARGFAGVFEGFFGKDMTCVYEALAVMEKEKARFDLLLDVMRARLGEMGASHPAGAAAGARIEAAARAVGQSRSYNMTVSELLLDIWRILHD